MCVVCEREYETRERKEDRERMGTKPTISIETRVRSKERPWSFIEITDGPDCANVEDVICECKGQIGFCHVN